MNIQVFILTDATIIIDVHYVFRELDDLGHVRLW